MLIIECPYCGARDEHEFHFGGEAHLVRPDESVDDETWALYLYFRENPKGVHFERWYHRYGCGTWFNVVRDTVTHGIACVYPITDQHPPQESA